MVDPTDLPLGAWSLRRFAADVPPSTPPREYRGDFAMDARWRRASTRLKKHSNSISSGSRSWQRRENSTRLSKMSSLETLTQRLWSRLTTM